MSTVERAKARRTLPPLVKGERLEERDFHKRDEAMPPSTRVELVGGVVYMPSPMSSDHGDERRNVAGWLFHYQRKTTGVKGGDRATAKLFEQSEPQPDHHLRIPAALGGHTQVDAEDLDRLIEVLEQGLATPEHAAFAAKLAKARR
jgi:Putative restriction endonuclease